MKRILYATSFILFVLGLFSLIKQDSLINFAKEEIKNLGASVLEKSQDWLGMMQTSKTAIEEKFLIDTSPLVFTDKLVYTEGDLINVRYTGKGRLVASINRISNTGKKEEVEKINQEISTGKFAVYSSFDGIVSPYDELVLNSDKIGNGWFSITFQDINKKIFDVPFFIEPQLVTKKILFVESTDTFKAYNPAAKIYQINNFYEGSINTKSATIIPPNTPYIYNFPNTLEIPCNDHLINSDIVHKSNLMNMGVDFQTVSDQYLDEPIDNDRIDLIIFGSHNEYWTALKAENIMNFIDSGGRVLLLGGNQAWRRVYRDRNDTWLSGDGLLKDKTFYKLVSKYLGSYYTHSDYNTYSELKVVDTEILKNRFSLNLIEETRIGTGTNFQHCKTIISGVSGHETDKILFDSAGFNILAKGQNDNGGADVLYKLFPSNGEVLNFSSVSLWHNKDPQIFKIIKSYIEKNHSKRIQDPQS